MGEKCKFYGFLRFHIIPSLFSFIYVHKLHYWCVDAWIHVYTVHCTLCIIYYILSLCTVYCVYMNVGGWVCPRRTHTNTFPPHSTLYNLQPICIGKNWHRKSTELFKSIEFFWHEYRITKKREQSWRKQIELMILWINHIGEFCGK